MTGVENKYITAVELQSGLKVGTFYRRSSFRPKQDLLKKIAYLVDRANIKELLASCKERIEMQRKKYDDEIQRLQQARDALTFPLNDIDSMIFRQE